jgi:hypothetical protein
MREHPVHTLFELLKHSSQRSALHRHPNGDEQPEQEQHTDSAECERRVDDVADDLDVFHAPIPTPSAAARRLGVQPPAPPALPRPLRANVRA